MKRVMNEKGTILVTMLMFLVVVTIICVVLLNISTVEVQVMGNLKQSSAGMDAAEAGVELSVPLIEATLLSSELTTTVIPGVTIDSGTHAISLQDEILAAQADSHYYADVNYDPSTSNNPNLLIASQGPGSVFIDIDRMYSTLLPGGSLEFASGYEGIGASAAGGGVGIFYRIDSVAAK